MITITTDMREEIRNFISPTQLSKKSGVKLNVIYSITKTNTAKHRNAQTIHLFDLKAITQCIIDYNFVCPALVTACKANCLSLTVYAKEKNNTNQPSNFEPPLEKPKAPPVGNPHTYSNELSTTNQTRPFTKVQNSSTNLMHTPLVPLPPNNYGPFDISGGAKDGLLAEALEPEKNPRNTNPLSGGLQNPPGNSIPVTALPTDYITSETHHNELDAYILITDCMRTEIRDISRGITKADLNKELKVDADFINRIIREDNTRGQNAKNIRLSHLRGMTRYFIDKGIECPELVNACKIHNRSTTPRAKKKNNKDTLSTDGKANNLIRIPIPPNTPLAIVSEPSSAFGSLPPPKKAKPAPLELPQYVPPPSGNDPLPFGFYVRGEADELLAELGPKENFPITNLYNSEVEVGNESESLIDVLNATPDNLFEDV